MKASDNEETTDATNEQELEAFLARRYEMDGVRVNSFMMSHHDGGPVLAILVRDDLACLDYMADSEGTAFTSQGDMPTLVKGEMTEFRLHSQRQPVLNSHIVSYAQAVRAAKEFLHTKDLPTSVKWLQL